MFDMIDISSRKDGDRLIVVIEPNEPVALSELGHSFAALSQIYDRNYGDSTGARLYLTKVSSGSVVAEVAPYAIIMGGIAMMDASVIVADFSKRLGEGLQAFAGMSKAPPGALVHEDAEDLKTFVKPMLGKAGASLGLKRASYSAVSADGSSVHVDYEFAEAELNRAAANMDRYLEAAEPSPITANDEFLPFEKKLLLVEQASRGPGKLSGRTGDRGLMPDFEAKASLPLHFAKSVNDIKARMVRTAVNPLAEYAFIVSGYLVERAGVVRSYLITEIHDVVERPE